MKHDKSRPVLAVKELSPQAAVPFIRAYHYSQVLPRLNRHYVGFFEGGELSGVVALSWGTQPLPDHTEDIPRPPPFDSRLSGNRENVLSAGEKRQRVFWQPCPVRPCRVAAGKHRLSFSLHPCGRHYGEMRLCVPSGEFPLSGELYHQRLPGHIHRGEDTPPKCRDAPCRERRP